MMVILMVKYKEAKSKITIVGITMAFAIVAAILIVIGIGNDALSWMKTTGIVLFVISTPIILFFLYKMVMKKIREM